MCYCIFDVSHLLLSLTFADKAWTYPSGAPIRDLLRYGTVPYLARQYQTKVDSTLGDKHIRLLNHPINYARKSFIVQT
jgi:hypothetical protein